MRVLIVEDITLVAERISDLAKAHLKDCTTKISHTLEDAKLCITEETYDLLFLDLNLKGKDGYELLKSTTSESFQTIVITANRDQASHAFDFGVFDFISKPISENRFKIAIERFLNNDNLNREKLKYLSIKSRGIINLIALKDVNFIKASGNYSEVFTIKNECFLHDKNIDKLLNILRNDFVRVHRSYIIPKDKVLRIIKHGGGKYSIELINGELVPLSRDIYKELFKVN